MATKKKIQEFLETNGYEERHPERLDILHTAVEDLAKFFKVSKQAAKYRMVELGFMGYADAEIIFSNEIIMHNEYSITDRPLTVKPSNRPLTRHIDLATAFDEYQNNDTFREMLASGIFRYVEGAFVLSDEKYCKKDGRSGVYRLTKYARDNPTQCTLLFTYRIKTVDGSGPQIFDYPLPPNVMQMVTNARHMTSVSTEYRKLPHYVPNSQNDNVRDEATKLKIALKNVAAEFDDFAKDKQADKPDFWTKVAQIMERKKISKNKFKILTLLDDNTISRTGGNAIYGKNPPQKLTSITLRVAMQVCIGLDLDVTQSRELLELARLALSSDRECAAYEFVLTSFRGTTIDERNIVLEGLGIEPLGRKSKL